MCWLMLQEISAYSYNMKKVEVMKDVEINLTKAVMRLSF